MGVSRNRWLCLCHNHVLEEWHLSLKECKLYGLASVAGPLGFIRPRALLEVAVSCEHCWLPSPFMVKGERDMSGFSIYGPWKSQKEWMECSRSQKKKWHCEIKINWQEMFVIQIPRRAEGTGRERERERVMWEMEWDLQAFVSLHWKGDMCPKLMASSRKSVLYGDNSLQRDRRNYIL